MQVIGDVTSLAGDRRIDCMLYDSRHGQLVTGSTAIEILPLTRAPQHTDPQQPRTHHLPVTVVRLM